MEDEKYWTIIQNGNGFAALNEKSREWIDPNNIKNQTCKIYREKHTEEYARKYVEKMNGLMKKFRGNWLRQISVEDLKDYPINKRTSSDEVHI